MKKKSDDAVNKHAWTRHERSQEVPDRTTEATTTQTDIENYERERDGGESHRSWKDSFVVFEIEISYLSSISDVQHNWLSLVCNIIAMLMARKANKDTTPCSITFQV